MDLIIKSLSGVLEEEEKKVIRKKLLWFDEHLPNNAVMTVGVRHRITKKSNQAYEIIIHLNTPKTRRAVYIRIAKDNLPEAINQAREKMERIVLKKKDKKQFKLKMPRLSLRKKSQ
jgi:ribosome-associated translation inhibitor RaiA